MKSPEYKNLFIAEIDCAGRLRGLSAAHVEALAHSIEEYGQQTPVLVRKNDSGQGFKLMAGAHRIAAILSLERQMVSAKIYSNISDEQARLIEIDENLIRNELNPLDRAVFLAERKAIYEGMYPEVKNGAQGGRGGKKNESGMFSFSKNTAEKLGLSKRTIERAISIASIPTDLKEKLILAGYIREGELYRLSQQDKNLQGQIVDLILDKSRPENNVKAAAHFLSGKGTVQIDKTEKQYNRILTAWLVSGTAARQKFRDYLGGLK